METFIIEKLKTVYVFESTYHQFVRKRDRNVESNMFFHCPQGESLTKYISTIDFGGQKKICLKGNIIPNYSIKTESFKFHIIHQFSYIFLNLSTVNKFIPFECWKVHIYELSIILLNNIIHMTVFVVHNC